MKKIIMMLACCVMLSGCGSDDTSSTLTYSDEQQDTTIKESEEEAQPKQSNNLYETEKIFIKSIDNAEYPVPESWNNNSKVDGKYTYYYGDKTMLMVYKDEMDGIKPFQDITSDELNEYRESILNGLKSGFDSYRELSSRDYKGNGGARYIRYTADVKLNGSDYSFDMIVFAGNDEIYCFGMLIDSDSEKAYAQELRYLRENIIMNVEYKENPDSDESDLNSNIISQLKELYKQQAKDLSFSEDDSKSYFEIVLKSIKEIAKRGENVELESFVDDELFSPFVLSAGYLCNNYDEDTEYGKVGNMAFELIGYIVSKDNENRDKILNEFDSIATEHGMEIIMLDDSENKAEESSETESQEPIELSTGKYIVGEDIPAGKYDIIGIKGGNVRVCSPGKDYGDILSEIIEEGEIVYSNVKLENGQTIEIVNRGKIKLQPK